LQKTRASSHGNIHKNQRAHPDAPKPIHPDKEQIRSRQSSWEQTSKFLQPPTFAGMAEQKIETRISL
jgi:hypothetical protein